MSRTENRRNPKTKKNTKSRSKTRTTNRKSKRNINRRRMQKQLGGNFMGEGAFGTVYGEPRLLCDGESSATENIDREVSKIFRFNKLAEDEYGAISRLSSMIPPDEYEELKKYTLLPLKKCIVDVESTKQPPYSNREWRRNDNFESGNEDIFKHDASLTTSMEKPDGKGEPEVIYRNMIIYDKGGNNLTDCFSKIKSVDMFLDSVRKLLSVGKGIQILQKHGFIHGDLKDKNCIEHENKYKIIDMADVRDIATTTTAKQMPFAFGYFTWPSISVYTHYFNNQTPSRMGKIRLTVHNLKALFNEQGDFNSKMYSQWNNGYMNAPYGIFKTKYGFSDDEVNVALAIRDKLDLQKKLEVRGNWWENKDIRWRSIIEEGVTSREEYDYYTLFSEAEVQPFLEKYNRIFQSFSSPEELKMDLFKRIDIYSFGMLILLCISMFYSNVIDFKRPVLPDNLNLRNVLINLIKIVDECCDQKERVVDINKIIADYEAVLDLISPPPALVSAPPVPTEERI